MSDGGMERTPVRVGKEDTIDDQAPISAQPPKAIPQEESQLGMSAAFQCLDALFQDGKLAGTKVARLKAKYSDLHQAVKIKRDNEATLRQKAKYVSVELERQKSELEKADNFPEVSEVSEVSELRQLILKSNNDLAQTDERQYQLDYNIAGLHEEKEKVEKVYAGMPKQGEVEKQIEELTQVCMDMRKEIQNRQMEAKNLNEELDKKNQAIQKSSKEYEGIADDVEKLKGDLAAVNVQPGQISKEADRYQRQKKEVEKKQKEVDNNLKDLMEALQSIQSKHTQLEKEKFEYGTEVNKQASHLNDCESAFQGCRKDYEYLKEEETVHMGDRATLDLNLKHINLEQKALHYEHKRKTQAKDRELRNLKKSELSLKVAEDDLNRTTHILQEVKTQIDAQRREDGSLLQKRTELQRELEQIKLGFAQQISLTAAETVNVEQLMPAENRLLWDELSDVKTIATELVRQATSRNDEREQYERQCTRLKMRCDRLVQDLKAKQPDNQAKERKLREIQTKLKDFAKLYDDIKYENGKCVNLIQTSMRKAGEMKEKIKLFQNELVIYRHSASKKHRLFQKEKLKHVNDVLIRHSLRNDVSKQQRIDEDVKEKREQHELDIDKLKLLKKQAEEQIVKQRTRYDTIVQQRKDWEIQLNQRKEEVRIIYEKFNIQEQMKLEAIVKLHSREDEIRFHKIQLNEEKRAVELLQQSLPNKHSLEEELLTLQTQLSQCQDRILELEKRIQNTDGDRMRLLEGKDYTPSELHTKLEELVVRLSEKEEALLEKDFIFDQVCRLCERVNNKAFSHKEDAVTLAKKTNELQFKIKGVTRNMMAIVAELAMHQANALQLQQQVKESEADLAQCYRRMERGEPPSEGIDASWQRAMRNARNRKQEKEAAKMAAEEAKQYELPGGIVTTAEPRPNAYIPDDDSELPIPRPYGSNAPFKPTEPGSTMRHIRNPIPKPLEI